MKSDYPKIFEPITIKRTTIKNRIAMTPMGTNYGETSGEMSNWSFVENSFFIVSPPFPASLRAESAMLLIYVFSRCRG